jgi:hypothetical protein
MELRKRPYPTRNRPFPDERQVESWPEGHGRRAGPGPGRSPLLFEAVERVKGIEPSYAAWEAAVLPLNYTRNGANCMR